MAFDVALDGNGGGGGNGGHQPSATAESGGHLRALLLDVGVGSRWTPRELEARSGSGIGFMTWYRLIGEPNPKTGKFYLCDETNLPLIARTLIALGANTTLKKIQQAHARDKEYNRSTGYDTLKAGVLQADAILGVITSLPDASQLQLLEDLVPFLPQKLKLKLLHTLAGLVAGEAVEQREGEQQHDDDDGPGLRP